MVKFVIMLSILSLLTACATDTITSNAPADNYYFYSDFYPGYYPSYYPLYYSGFDNAAFFDYAYTGPFSYGFYSYGEHDHTQNRANHHE